MPFRDKLSDRNISDKEWRIFERHLTKWLSDNSRNLTHEEGKHFRTATAICLTTGVSTGVFTNVLLNRFKLFPNRLTRGLFSVFGGLYTSAFTINSLRKSIYLKLLDSTGPAGFASRKILESTKELSLEQNYVDPIYLPSYKPGSYTPGAANAASNTAHGTTTSGDASTSPSDTYSTNSNSYSPGYPPSIAQGSNDYPVEGLDSRSNESRDGYRTWEEIRRGNG
ncbi:conserved hypothetical protein [Theileria orientalis strain Shintoku]|uniref:Uncharacterized protein n=1 Tax=Theileria orientalis strain Shintoku TaxID=869250 RepID=J4DPF8_THEOR|nr:conserved hypothetical protein [Theileria orientalis strain Shintoku]PVC54490.1 hypothetical protein MACL_00003037 [Theileria orientalis]BAM40629.1 conserved hypothetical protein [Theileria orientalis strain Shintoku]|eukprot:XP_009690930.1 conserved hypothetical protein [Theileria orientalis strain Shintoku]